MVLPSLKSRAFLRLFSKVVSRCCANIFYDRFMQHCIENWYDKCDSFDTFACNVVTIIFKEDDSQNGWQPHYAKVWKWSQSSVVWRWQTDYKKLNYFAIFVWHKCDALAVAVFARYYLLELIAHSLTCGDAPDITFHNV